MSEIPNNIRVIIPAAGKGTRLKCNDIPKAMYELCSEPLLQMVLKNTDFIPPENTYIIVGYQKEKIIDYFGKKYNYVVQDKQLGTGHAVSVCSELFKDFDGAVLVTFGDMPLFRKEILKKICEHHINTNAACTLLTANDPDVKDWAKIIRDKKGNFEAIIEGVDCTEEQNKTGELFAGVLVFDSKILFQILPELSCENVQREYYLTEVPKLIKEKGLLVETFMTDDNDDLCGVNHVKDIKICEQIIIKRKNI